MLEIVVVSWLSFASASLRKYKLMYICTIVLLTYLSVWKMLTTLLILWMLCSFLLFSVKICTQFFSLETSANCAIDLKVETLRWWTVNVRRIWMYYMLVRLNMCLNHIKGTIIIIVFLPSGVKIPRVKSKV